jgi:hypothetical protein
VTIRQSSLPVRSGALVATLVNRNGFDVNARLTLSMSGTRAAANSAATALVAASRTRNIRVRLSRAQTTQLRRRKRVRATLAALVTDPAGTRRSVRRSVVLVLR